LKRIHNYDDDLTPVLIHNPEKTWSLDLEFWFCNMCVSLHQRRVRCLCSRIIIIQLNCFSCMMKHIHILILTIKLIKPGHGVNGMKVGFVWMEDEMKLNAFMYTCINIYNSAEEYHKANRILLARPLKFHWMFFFFFAEGWKSRIHHVVDPFNLQHPRIHYIVIVMLIVVSDAQMLLVASPLFICKSCFFFWASYNRSHKYMMNTYFRLSPFPYIRRCYYIPSAKLALHKLASKLYEK
jgi:hypothetical protein